MAAWQKRARDSDRNNTCQVLDTAFAEGRLSMEEHRHRLASATNAAKSDGVPAKVVTPPRQLQSLGGINGIFEQMRQTFGATLGYGLTIRPDRATLYRPDPEDPRRKLMYGYRGGWGDPNVGLVRGAPDTVRIKRNDVNDTYPR